MRYLPDRWVVIEVTTVKEKIRKVLAGWSGGYLDGDSWRMNSGITSITKEEDHLLIHGHSGSVYVVDIECYGLSFLTSSILTQMMETVPKGTKVRLVPKEEVWVK
jgi:hypothetical protein